MKNCIVVILVFLLQVSVSLAQTKKAVFIIVDGIPADVIEKLQPPTLYSIAKLGGFTKAYVGGEKNGYSQTPTISAVGYNSLLTATWVNKHNVWDNDIKAPNYNYHTIFRTLKESRPSATTAIFSTWLDNRTKLVGDELAATGNIKLDYHFDGLELDTMNFPHDKEAAYIHLIDERVTDTAAAYIKRSAPDLSWVYLEYTDDMGHRFGDSEQLYKAIGYMDNQLKRIWEAVRYREQNFKEQWVVYITTDHGRDSATGKNHGGQSDRERTTWIATNASGLNSYFHNDRPGVVDIFPSIASFMGIKVPREQLMEMDGVPLVGKVSAVSPSAQFSNGKISVGWKAVSKTGKAKIWLTTTNNFKAGGKDEYRKVAEVELAAQKAVIDVSKLPSDFYKIVIETPDNFLNRWIMLKK